MHARWEGNLKGEEGNLLIGDKMEIIYSGNPHYPVDFHPTDTKRSSYLPPTPPPLLQFPIPFDFMTKICKSETQISPAMLMPDLHVWKGGMGTAPTFKPTVILLDEKLWQQNCMPPSPEALSTLRMLVHWLFCGVVILCKILNSYQDGIKKDTF